MLHGRLREARPKIPAVRGWELPGVKLGCGCRSCVSVDRFLQGPSDEDTFYGEEYTFNGHTTERAEAAAKSSKGAFHIQRVRGKEYD